MVKYQFKTISIQEPTFRGQIQLLRVTAWIKPAPLEGAAYFLREERDGSSRHALTQSRNLFVPSLGKDNSSSPLIKSEQSQREIPIRWRTGGENSVI